MNDIFHLSLPFEDPVLIFGLVLLIILLVPLILKRFSIPGVIGLIFAGILIGPNGFNLLLRDSSIVLFGTVGLLYIMFLAGLEIDLTEFKKNKHKSIIFGLLTFSIPMVFGTLVSYYILSFSLSSSVLLASMFASHTLLTYPITSRLGISKLEAVNIAVGGTIITDTAALLVLAVIAGSADGQLDTTFWMRLGIGLTIFTVIVLVITPRIARWFFRNLEAEGSSQFIFVLAIVFISAFLAELAGVEPIIGAFLAGLAINKLIPSSSALMNRIEFVGNTLFIPFFLISVGMLVDFRVLFRGPTALIVALTMVVLALSTKWLAAFFTQKFFKYNIDERNIIFGLSNSQAAATLAAVLVGFNLGLLSEDVLNGTIIMILVTCVFSSVITENSGRKLAIVENEKKPDVKDYPERILVPVSNPNNIEPLVDLAIMLRDPDSQEPIYPLTVVKDDEEAKEKIALSTKALQKAIKHAAASDIPVHIASRVDVNTTAGIIRAMKELMISEVVMGWNGKITTKNMIFGSVLDSLLHNSRQMIFVSKIVYPINTVKKIIVAIPSNAEFEIGFPRWIKAVKTISKQTGSHLAFYGAFKTLEATKFILKSSGPQVEASFTEFNDWDDFLILAKHVTSNDLFVVINARQQTISYSPSLDEVPRYLSKYFADTNFIILYPEQYTTVYPNTSFI